MLVANLAACQRRGLSSGICCALSSRRPQLRSLCAAAGDTVDKLRSHALRTARAWSLDGLPLLGISVFAVLGITLDELLARRFATFRTVCLPTAGQLGERGLELLATGQSPHYTVRLRRADDSEIGELLAALGPAQANPQYGRNSIWREEG